MLYNLSIRYLILSFIDCEGGYSIFLDSVNLIAPVPISRTNPIVKMLKNIIAIENPKTLTWYKLTARGNNNKISKSKI